MRVPVFSYLPFATALYLHLRCRAVLLPFVCHGWSYRQHAWFGAAAHFSAVLNCVAFGWFAWLGFNGDRLLPFCRQLVWMTFAFRSSRFGYRRFLRLAFGSGSVACSGSGCFLYAAKSRARVYAAGRACLLATLYAYC